MSNVEILDKTKKKKILNKLEEEFGIKKLNHLFIKSGNNRLRIFSGSLSKEELNTIAKKIHVELIGSRIVNIEKDDIRISFDAINIPEIKSQINKNIIEITDDQAKEWMKGNDLDIEIVDKARFIIIKNKEDFLGVGKVQGTFIKNYVPKERRVK